MNIVNVLAEPLAVQFIGHPFAAIGKGEEIRANIRALLSIDEPVQVLDIYRAEPRQDIDHLALIEPREIRRLSRGPRVFHINGDEVEPVQHQLAALGSDFTSGRNIVVPAWELPVYPAIWAELLKRFDEVWAISRFVQEGLAASGVEAHHVGQSVDIPIRAFLSRRHFGIRDSAFAFLCFFDYSSHVERKNPLAAIAVFRRLLAERPFDDIQIVIKAKGNAEEASLLGSQFDLPLGSYVIIDRLLSTFEQHSLMASCDCLVSLHRAEGFGRGPGEAMRLGRLVLATGWSGNIDFMDDGNSLLVSHELVPVPPGAYPHGEGQVWAEPDLDHATALARRALDDPAGMRRVSMKGMDDIIRRMGDRAVGLRILDRLARLPA